MCFSLICAVSQFLFETVSHNFMSKYNAMQMGKVTCENGHCCGVVVIWSGSGLKQGKKSGPCIFVLFWVLVTKCCGLATYQELACVASTERGDSQVQSMRRHDCRVQEEGRGYLLLSSSCV